MNEKASTTATTLAVSTVWDKATEKQVSDFVASGASVPKGLMKLAPKGFVSGLRATRKAELQTNTAQLLGGFQDRGFQIVACSPIKTAASGVETVNVRLQTPRPTSKMTMEEFAKAHGTSVEDLLATVEMTKK